MSTSSMTGEETEREEGAGGREREGKGGSDIYRETKPGVFFLGGLRGSSFCFFKSTLFQLIVSRLLFAATITLALPLTDWVTECLQAKERSGFCRSLAARSTPH